jgi:hypothetical protein
MCFSEKASLIALVAGLSSSLACYSVGKPEYKIVGLFFAFVTLMQLVDYLLWKHQVCDAYNKMVSFVGMILNHLQPVVLFTLLWYFNKPTDIRVLVVYLFFIIPYSFRKLGCTLKGSDSHMWWSWNTDNNELYKQIVYGVFILSLALMAYKGLGRIEGLYIVLTFAITNMVYNQEYSVGSLWCFFVVISPLVYMLKN